MSSTENNHYSSPPASMGRQRTEDTVKQDYPEESIELVDEDSTELMKVFFNPLRKILTADRSQEGWQRMDNLQDLINEEARKILKIKPRGESKKKTTLVNKDLQNASKIQKLFKRNRRQAMWTINGEKRKDLPFGSKEIDHFAKEWDSKD